MLYIHVAFSFIFVKECLNLCIYSSPWEERFEKYTSLYLTKVFNFDKTDGSLEITCTFDLSTNSSNVYWEVYSETDKSIWKSIDQKIENNALQMTFKITKNSYDSSYHFLFFPRWKMNLIADGRILVRGDMIWVNHFVTMLFTEEFLLSGSNRRDNTIEQISGESMGNKDVKFLFVVSMHGREIGIHLLLAERSYGVLFIEVETVISKVTSFTVSCNAFLFVANGVFYRLVLENDKFVLEESKSAKSNYFEQFSYIRDFNWYGLEDPEKSEIVVLYTDQKDGYLHHAKHPFRDVSAIKLPAQYLNNRILDALYDIERDRFIVAMEETNNQSSFINVVVLAHSSDAICWTSFQESSVSFQNLTYDKIMSHHVVLLNEKWISKDGGCFFRKEIDLSKFLSVNFISKRVLQLTQNRTSISSLSSNRLSTFKLYYFGILETVPKEGLHPKYHLTKRFPLSNTVLTQDYVYISFIHGSFYNLTLQTFYWPNFSISKTFHCFQSHVTCRIISLISNNTAFSECIFHDDKFKVKITVKCNRKLWYILQNYNTILKNVNITIDKKQNVIFSNLPNETPELIYFSNRYSTGYLSKDSNNNYTVKTLTGETISGLHNVNIESTYETIFDVIYQKETKCPFKLTVTGISNRLIYLDVDEKAELNVTLKIDPLYILPHEIIQKKLLQARLSNPFLVNIRTVYAFSKNSQTLRLWIYERPSKYHKSFITSLHISNVIEDEICNDVTYHLKIVHACAKDKYLLFKYPLDFSVEDFFDDAVFDQDDFKRLYTLPVNYQPPSKKGVAIPTSRNIYHADPSKSMHHEKYLKNQPAPIFKYCKNKVNRASCNCSVDMVTSFLEADSDCLFRVYRLFYLEKLTPKIFLQHGSKITQIKEPYRVIEVNNRTDFFFSDTFNDDGETLISESSISFEGSGLYHFRVELVKKSLSVCDLKTEFIVFLDGFPFAQPTEDLVRAATAFLFGGTVVSIFLYQYYKYKDE